jgi:chromosome segregation and condensation protein ScpB
MNPERASILLAFREEDQVLTRREILDRSGLRDDQHVQDLMQMRLLGQREWQPNVPRQYFLTPAGRDKRAECTVGD